MVADWWPSARRREVPYWPSAGRLNQPPLGWILHVTVMNGSPFGTFAGAVPPGRRFSHLWFAKNGAVEQYAPFSSQSWAQVSGNATYWSCETEGFPNEPLTGAQIQALAQFHVFCGAADSLAEAPGQRGIGTHYMGGSAWGGHTCPDPVPGAGPRSRQRPAILSAARAIRAAGGVPSPVPGPSDPLTQDDLNAIAAIVWGARFGTGPTTGQLLQHAALDPQAVANAVVAQLPPAGRPLTEADVEAAVRAVLDNGTLP